MNYSLPFSPQRLAIILNGERCHLDAKHFSHYQYIIVTDGAWNDLAQTAMAELQATNQLIVLGDGDSINPIKQTPKQFIHTPNQQCTDFEKAVQYAIQHDMTDIDVYWASGGEMDHFLGNLSVASHYAEHINMRFFDVQQCYFFLHSTDNESVNSTDSTAQKTITIQGIQGKTVSLYPFPEATITSHGLRYPLNALRLTQATQQSLRNHAVSDVTLHFSGRFWVFVQNRTLQS